MLSADSISRRTVLQGGLAMGLGALSVGALSACSTGGGAAQADAAGPLNVTFFSGTTPANVLPELFAEFTKKTGVQVNFQAEPAQYPQTVTKFTTALAAGSDAYDVLWLDDIMVDAFAPAGWILPLDGLVSRSTVAAVPAANKKLSSVAGKLYRVPGITGLYVQNYRADHLKAANISVPTTWNEYLKAAQALTKDGKYGVGLVGAEWDDYIQWLPQAGGSFVDLEHPGSQTALEFLHDLVTRYKVVPPSFPTDLLNNLTTYFQSGYISLLTAWNQTAITGDPALTKAGANGLAPVPRGPKTDLASISDWGWTISKYSKRQKAAAKFIDFVASKSGELAIAKTSQIPVRLDAQAEAFTSLSGGAAYAKVFPKSNPLPRPLAAQSQILWKNLTPVLTEYVSGKTTLRSVTQKGQALIKQYS